MPIKYPINTNPYEIKLNIGENTSLKTLIIPDNISLNGANIKDSMKFKTQKINIIPSISNKRNIFTSSKKTSKTI